VKVKNPVREARVATSKGWAVSTVRRASLAVRQPVNVRAAPQTATSANPPMDQALKNAAAARTFSISEQFRSRVLVIRNEAINQCLGPQREGTMPVA
jgi:hypothetical protein